MSKSLIICLHFIVFFAVFNFTTAIMSGSYIASELGGAPEISTYGVTFFGLGNACLYPLGYYLKTRFDSFKILLFSMVFFCVATYLCAVSPTFFLFNVARFFAGAASGMFVPLSLGLLTQYQPKKAESILVFFAFVATVTPVVGACFGGWVAYDLEWQWIFYGQIPILLLLGGILYAQRIPYVPKEYKPFDLVGYIFFNLSITSFVTSLTLAEQLDWFRSPFICFLFVLSIICFVFFCLWEWNHESPILDLKLFKIPMYVISIFCLVFLFSAYFGTILMFALWLNIDVSYTPLWISLLIAHMIISGGVLFFTLKRWFEKVASLWVVLIAICFFAVSCFYSTTFNAEINYGRLATARTITGFGLAFFLFPLLFACLKALPEELKTQGMAIFQTCRLLSGSLGCALYTTIWFRRRIFYRERLGEQLSIYSEQTKEFFSNVSFYGPSGLKADLLLDKALGLQSDALALADCFYLMGWLLVGVFIITLLYLVLPHFKKIQLKSQSEPN